jgi:hypothetical protein
MSALVPPVRAAAPDVRWDEHGEFNRRVAESFTWEPVRGALDLGGTFRNRQRTGLLGRHGRGSVRRGRICGYAIRVSEQDSPLGDSAVDDRGQAGGYREIVPGAIRRPDPR